MLEVNIAEAGGSSNLGLIGLSRLQLLQRLEAEREAERQRLSRELHDQIGQDLVALSLELHSLKKKVIFNHKAYEQLEQVQEIVAHLDQRVHDFAWELRPVILDDLGLQVALLTLVEKWSVKSDIRIAFQAKGIDKLKLPPNVESGIYRIVQEGLTNISKHSNASSVKVTIRFQSSLLTVVISDDGQGFDVVAARSNGSDRRSFGLIGMLERVELIGGILDISSKNNCGTKIRVSVPLFPRKKDRYVKATHLSC